MNSLRKLKLDQTQKIILVFFSSPFVMTFATLLGLLVLGLLVLKLVDHEHLSISPTSFNIFAESNRGFFVMATIYCIVFLLIYGLPVYLIHKKIFGKVGFFGILILSLLPSIIIYAFFGILAALPVAYFSLAIGIVAWFIMGIETSA